MNDIIKEELKKRRLEKKMTQMQVATQSGLSLVTINKAEKTGKMRLSTYYKILNVLK